MEPRAGTSDRARLDTTPRSLGDRVGRTDSARVRGQGPRHWSGVLAVPCRDHSSLCIRASRAGSRSVPEARLGSRTDASASTRRRSSIENEREARLQSIRTCVRPLPMALQPGLPPKWHDLAARVQSRTGRRLLLRAPVEAFSSGAHDVEVRLDGELLGQFEFWWDDEDPDQALGDLEVALAPYLDEELKREDW